MTFTADHTSLPNNDEHTSASLESLATVMLSMMGESRDSLDDTPGKWSTEALDFVRATSSVSPEELSYVSGHDVLVVWPKAYLTSMHS